MNLFKILCAVQNLRPNQRGSYQIDDGTLESLTSKIFKQNVNSEDNIFQQVLVIRELIDRPAYTMTNAQIYKIHSSFRNWYEHRLRKTGGYDALSRAGTSVSHLEGEQILRSVTYPVEIEYEPYQL